MQKRTCVKILKVLLIFSKIHSKLQHTFAYLCLSLSFNLFRNEKNSKLVKKEIYFVANIRNVYIFNEMFTLCFHFFRKLYFPKKVDFFPSSTKHSLE